MRLDGIVPVLAEVDRPCDLLDGALGQIKAIQDFSSRALYAHLPISDDGETDQG